MTALAGASPPWALATQVPDPESACARPPSGWVRFGTHGTLQMMPTFGGPGSMPAARQRLLPEAMSLRQCKYQSATAAASAAATQIVKANKLAEQIATMAFRKLMM